MVYYSLTLSVSALQELVCSCLGCWDALLPPAAVSALCSGTGWLQATLPWRPIAGCLWVLQAPPALQHHSAFITS